MKALFFHRPETHGRETTVEGYRVQDRTTNGLWGSET